MKQHRNQKRMIPILTLLCFVLAGFAAYQIIALMTEYAAGKRSYEALPAPQQVSTEAIDETTAFTVNFDALSQLNPDCIAWLLCEDTTLSYPVVQGEDNAYYLNHLFNNETNGAGCLFLDAANQADFSDRNSIIYGHAMKNGTMFASLAYYAEQAYYEAHPVMHLLTPYGSYQVQIFAAGVASVEEPIWETTFEAQENFAEWLNAVSAISQLQTSTMPSSTDRVLTLSTCTYGGSDDARFVVLGVLSQE